MGNVMNSGWNHRRPHGISRNHPFPPPPAPPQPEIAGNRYVFASASPYPSPYPNPYPNPPQPYHYSGYYHPPPALPVHLPAPFDHHHPGPAPPPMDSNWVAGPYPYAPVALPPTPCIEHQKAVTIRNDVNIKKETLRIEPDEENPGKFLVAFTFDATVPGSITVTFFGKEGEDCTLIAMKETELKPVTVDFEQGLGQRFKQPSGTGIDASTLEEAESLGGRDSDVFPLTVKAASSHRSDENSQLANCQITQAIFEKEKDAYRVRVLKQILWVNGTRYELQEIYGTGNSVDTDVDGNDPGKECVICLSEPRDTTVLPCRHMCLCSGCAKVLRFQSSRCPICRQPVERLLEMKVGGGSED